MTVTDQPMPIVQTLWGRQNEEAVGNEETQPIPKLTLGGVQMTPRPPRVNLIKILGSRALPEPTPAEQAVSAEALVQVQANETAPARPPLPVRPVGESLRDMPVGVEETIGSPSAVAADLQDRNPHLIIWYGEHTKEYWVLSDALRSYPTYSALIQSLNTAPAPA